MLICIIGLIIFLISFYLEKKTQTKETKEPINLTLQVGIILIILSAIILITSTWKLLGSGMKVTLLASLSVIFIIGGIFLKNCLDVYKTGNGLTFLGCIFISITYISMGYYNMFGEIFSIYGNLNYLFISSALALECICLIIREHIIKNKNYFIILILILSSFYLLLHQAFKNVIVSSLGTITLLLIINIVKEDLMDNAKDLNIINLIIITISTTLFPYLCIECKNNYTYYNNIFLVINLIILCLNLIKTIKPIKNNFYILIIYETILSIFMIPSFKNKIIMGIFFLLTSLTLYFVHYKSKEHNLKISTYLSSIVHSNMACIVFLLDNKTYIISTILGIINIVFLQKKYKNKIITRFNSIIKPISTLLFVTALLKLLKLLPIFNLTNIIFIFIISIVLLLMLDHNKENTIKKYYYYILLFLLTIISLANNVPRFYKIVLIIADLLLILDTNKNTNNVIGKLEVPFTIISIINIIKCINNPEYLSSIIIITILTIMIIINRKNKNKYIDLTLMYIPLVLLTNNIFNMKNAIYSYSILFFLIFTRLYLDKYDNRKKTILELTTISIISMFIPNNYSLIILLFYLIIITYIFSKKNKKLSLIYNDYTLLATIFIFLRMINLDNATIYIMLMILILILNQLIRLYLEDKKYFNIINSISLAILVITFIEKASLPCIISTLISIFFLVIINYLYTDKNTKKINKLYYMYPVYLLLDLLQYNTAKIILKEFLILYPITITLRNIFNIKERNSNIIEALIISILFIRNIFIIDIEIALALGLISLLLIIIGTIFKYNSYTYSGLLYILAIIFIQTINLWDEIPWWIYIFIVGVILIIISIIVEKNKK